jgi:hypothetical protein
MILCQSWLMDSMELICAMCALRLVSIFIINFYIRHSVLSHPSNLPLCPERFLVHFTGMFAIRAERDYVVNEDFMKAVRKVAEAKKLETTINSTWGGDQRDRK